MKEFDKYLQDLQCAWRKKNISTQEWGRQNSGKYEWIIPRINQWENFHPSIRGKLIEYLSKYGIKPHIGINNLKSSWVQCANLYFPLQDDGRLRTLFARFLKEHIYDNIEDIIAVEMEYELSGDLHPAKLLGETDGGRGYGQTLPDLAIEVSLKSGKKGLICIENKLVEHSFYRYTARRDKDRGDKKGNPDKSRCMNIHTVLNDIDGVCHQIQWGRKYWARLKEAIELEMFQKLTRCPAATAGYQLFRQQALCEGVAQSGKFDLVYSCVAFDERNDTLRHSLRTTGIDDFSQGWGQLFQGKSKFKTFTHQSWVNWVQEHGVEDHREWLDYVTERYEY